MMRDKIDRIVGLIGFKASRVVQTRWESGRENQTMIEKLSEL